MGKQFLFALWFLSLGVFVIELHSSFVELQAHIYLHSSFLKLSLYNAFFFFHWLYVFYHSTKRNSYCSWDFQKTSTQRYVLLATCSTQFRLLSFLRRTKLRRSRISVRIRTAIMVPSREIKMYVEDAVKGSAFEIFKFSGDILKTLVYITVYCTAINVDLLMNLCSDPY